LRLLLLALTTFATLACPALSAEVPAKPNTPDPLADCTGGDKIPRPQELAPCERIIQDKLATKAALAVALSMRCKIRNQNGDRDGALADCDRAVALQPKSADAYSARAELFDLWSQYDKAIADISMAIKLEKNPFFDYFRRAGYFNARAEFERFFPEQRAQRANDYDRAMADASEVLSRRLRKDADTNAQTVFYLLQEWAKREIVTAQEGKGEIKMGIRADPREWCRGNAPRRKEGPPFEDIELGCSAVIASATTTSAEKGEAYFRRAEAGRGESPELWFFGGFLGRRDLLSNASVGGAGGMVADYRAAIGLNANVPEAHFGLGIVYLLAGKYDVARTEFGSAIALNGRDLARYYDGRGDAEFFGGELDAAIADFDQSLKLKPGNGSVLLDRSVALDKKAEYGRALDDCGRAVSLSKDIFPDEMMAATVCGDINLHKGDLKSALASYDHAVSLAQKDNVAAPGAYYGRGVTKLRSGDKSGQADIDKAVGQDKNIAASEAKIGVGL
jgi:tetratricopeptide (TPR) repeat protein